MMVGMAHNEPTLPLPNAADWTDAAGAAAILGRSRSTVYDMVDRGILNKHRVGTSTLFWRAEVEEIRHSLDRLERQQAARNASING